MTEAKRRTDAVARTLAEYLGRFEALIGQIDAARIARVVALLRGARVSGATVYLAGNGGSAATAAHLANDLGKATKREGQRPFRVMCLSDNVSWLTALANDEGYERVFSGQLENFAEPGDVLLVISASGNSENLVRAVELARSRGVKTVGLLGFAGGRLKELVDECVWLESEAGVYGPVETAHALICDVINTCLMTDVDA